LEVSIKKLFGASAFAAFSLGAKAHDIVEL
jgi:hypothetical protein